MKTIFAAALVAAFTTQAFACDDHKDIKKIPADIRAKIKAQCEAKWPDDFFMQDGCRSVSVKGYNNMQALEAN